jgi:hypothetical protein
MVYINGKEHITLSDCACRLGIGYRAAHNYLTSHTEIPRQKIGRQFFVVYDDFSKHPRYVQRSGVLV